jgi:ribose transport system substrate-binding protein
MRFLNRSRLFGTNTGRKLTKTAFFFSVFLGGCSSGRKEIALLTPTTGTVFWDAVHKGAAFEASTCGLKVHYDAPPRADDLRTQLDLFKTFSREHYVAIVVAPVQERAMRDPIQRAASAGIPVIVLGADLGIRSPNIAYVLNDDELGGRLAARKIGEILHGKGKLAVMGIDLSRSISVVRDHAFEQELAARFPDIQVVQRTHGSTNLFEEQQSAENLLSLNGYLDAIVALSSFATWGAFYALDARHPTHKIHLVGFDQDLTLPVRNGEIDAIVAVKANDAGSLVSKLVCEHLVGKPWGGPYTTSPFLITSDNYKTPEVSRQLAYDWWNLADETR